MSIYSYNFTLWQDVNNYISRYGKGKFKRLFEKSFPTNSDFEINNLINFFFFICILGNYKEKFKLLCNDGFLLTTTVEISKALSIKKCDAIMAQKMLLKLGLFMVYKDTSFKKFICFPNPDKHNEIIVKLRTI
jgi:hypothetical protein